MKTLFKGIANLIKAFLKFLYKIIDKVIIMPLSKITYFIVDKLGLGNNALEKLFSKPTSLLVVSGVLAFAVFMFVDTKAVKFVETEAMVLSNQKVETIYNEEAYVVEGIPEKVDVTLMGRKSDLYLAKQLGEHTISLDLSGLGVGTHKVKLKYNNPIQALDYKLDPSTVNVTISPKVSEVRTLTTDIVNADKLNDKLIVSEVKLDRDEIIIKSSKEKLAKVSSVKALVDVNSLDANEAGTYTLDNVKLVSYDENGTEIKNIEIVPKKVNATIIISSPSKEVPIKVVPVGEVRSGSAIKSIERDVNKVVIYGEESVLNSIEFVPVEIDVNKLNKDKTYKTTIKKPAGIRSVSSTTITIKVRIEGQTSKDFNDIPVEWENLNTKYIASAASANDTKVNVLVKGVSTVINELDKKDIKAYVDLKDYEPGTWDVPVKVTGEDLRLSYSSKIKTIKIIITQK